MKPWLSLLLFPILLGACGRPVTVTNTPFPPSETATEAPTAIPTPTPIEVAPGEYLPSSQLVGYEARDNSGKLIYVKDINGKWIKASYEVTVAPATQEDWTNVNTRLGTDFAINTDGTITGIEGLNINMANGEATFNFDGMGTEVYHIGNIKVQEIGGVKRLLVAGYAWNGETKSWEIFNPGFPMESPEAQVGWFFQADVPNGNWLRWDQRYKQDQAIKAGFVKSDGTADVEKYMEHIFSGALTPDVFELREFNIQKDFNSDFRIDIAHLNALWWKSGEIDWEYTRNNIIKKDQYPWRGGLSYSYLVDGKSIIVSFDVLNSDRSTTSLPAIMGETVWSEHRDNGNFTRIAFAAGREWDESMAKEVSWSASNNPEAWFFWLISKFYPDATITPIFNNEFIKILQEPEAAARREASIGDNKFESSASLEIWGTEANYNYHK